MGERIVASVGAASDEKKEEYHGGRYGQPHRRGQRRSGRRTRKIEEMGKPLGQALGKQQGEGIVRIARKATLPAQGDSTLGDRPGLQWSERELGAPLGQPDLRRGT